MFLLDISCHCKGCVQAGVRAFVGWRWGEQSGLTRGGIDRRVQDGTYGASRLRAVGGVSTRGLVMCAAREGTASLEYAARGFS